LDRSAAAIEDSSSRRDIDTSPVDGTRGEPVHPALFFLGYGSTLNNGDAFGFDSLARQSDGFFLKLAYRYRR